ncbi:guanylate cyclase soluble subunit alpha-2-like isoform X1 [Centruroides sculpturatus]|uniref:guanylate cyclase soluble subunit alpha-2-like isoform X1 n=1 Tax=Centruroides sculpturatus TaxID=218467 RepID=UPI000C6E96A5|nr:guanylate cyclase soluble subunit alpha-2-like isoform X1 [Centruroides sculpturatus]
MGCPFERRTALKQNKTGMKSYMRSCSVDFLSIDKSDSLDEERLDLRGLTIAVLSLINPSNFAIYSLLEDAAKERKSNRRISFGNAEQTSDSKERKESEHISEQEIYKKISKLVSVLTIEETALLETCGSLHVDNCLKEHERALKFLGGTAVDLFTSLECLDYVRNKEDHNQREIFRVLPRSTKSFLILELTTKRKFWAKAFVGVIKKIIDSLFNLRTVIRIREKAYNSYIYEVKVVEQSEENASFGRSSSLEGTDTRLSVAMFCKTFPFHFIFDRNLKLVQVGLGLSKVLGGRNKRIRGSNVMKFFRILQPKLVPSFQAIYSRMNMPFLLSIQSCHNQVEGMALKGQMIYCPESESLLFLGSPVVDGLDEMNARGLYLSDIPIHDATRDIILVEEQVRAQDGLKRRMDKLKNSIQEANKAVEMERKKNVDLLHLVFPPNIARKLWLGEHVEAQQYDNVTMLFSDIVGFTAICSTATPMMVINMLNTLYTMFDVFCGELDVYKTETIGDAYCVAGGLHRPSKTHAQQTAWMALKMMNAAQTVHSHDGKLLQMRIGLHSGSVLAGVVGLKMPRYCLFGNNVTLANKFESGSKPGRINISPTTYSLLSRTDGFTFESRPPECLPRDFPTNIKGRCHFLDSYHHPDIEQQQPLDVHIKKIVEELKLDVTSHSNSERT